MTILILADRWREVASTSMEGDEPSQTQVADDLDDITTLMNLLELRARLRIESTHFETELD